MAENGKGVAETGNPDPKRWVELEDGVYGSRPPYNQLPLYLSEEFKDFARYCRVRHDPIAYLRSVLFGLSRSEKRVQEKP